MKKIIAIIVVLGGALILGAVVFLMPEPVAQVTQSVPAGNGVVKIKEVRNSNIRIIPGRTTKVTVDLEGPEDELKKIRFFRTGNDTEIVVSDKWKEVTGTIIVPDGTLVELDQPVDDNETDDTSEPSNFIRLGGGSSITIDDEEVIVTGSGGSTTPYTPPAPSGNNDSGDDEEEETVTPNPVPPSPPVVGDGGGDEGEGEGGGETPVEPETTQYAPEEPDDPNLRCSIKLKQEDRNDCCQTLFADELHPICSYTGYWLFNYHTRLCYYHCFHPCNKGDQESRDACCLNQHYYDTTPPCIGDWVYDDAINGCFYECMDADELDEYFDEGENQYTDFVSESCSSHSNPDLCCDYNLKNQLSIGPRPGFPDCIGRWAFNDANSTCEFNCADFGEMLDILKQLEEQRGE